MRNGEEVERRIARLQKALADVLLSKHDNYQGRPTDEALAEMRWAAK